MRGEKEREAELAALPKLYMISFNLHEQPHEIEVMSTLQMRKLRRGSVVWPGYTVRADIQNLGQSDSSALIFHCYVLPSRTKSSVINSVFLSPGCSFEYKSLEYVSPPTLIPNHAVIKRKTSRTKGELCYTDIFMVV